MALKKIVSSLFFLLYLTTLGLRGGLAEEGIYTSDYYLSFYPNYPPAVGENVTLRLKTFRPVQRVTIYSDRSQEIPLTFQDGYWWGNFQIPDDYQPGGHFFIIWVKGPFPTPPQPNVFDLRLIGMGVKKRPINLNWAKSILWYRMNPKGAPIGSSESFALPPGFSFEADEQEEHYIPVSGEATILRTPSVEASPFFIKGAKTLTFSTKSIEGTKEGFVPGVTREEGLRLNIAGKTGGTEVDANLISTSTTGTSQVAQRQDKISVLIKRASTEAYLGDFTADYNETEFAKLNKVLSGVRVRGDYGLWGFSALYSSPQGESRFVRLYGDGTQGPYRLDSAPVVIDSERVVLDGQLQKRGDDYTIDYEAGTITFIKKTIDPKWILNITYDYRQTVYSHATSGLRLFTRPTQNLKLGATYLDDSDSLAGAAEIRSTMSSEAINPRGHYLVGADGSFVSELLTANGEAAYSHRDLDLLSPGSAEAGKAVRLELSSQLGPIGLRAFGKRVGALFRPLAVSDAELKSDITDYGGGISWRAGSLFGAQADYSRDKYTQSSVVYDNSYRSAKASLTPDRLPSLEYNFSEDLQSNDPVTGSGIDRNITRQSAESVYRFGWLSSSVKGTREKWTNRQPSAEVTDYERVNLGLATIGLEKISFSSNVEQENRREPSGTTPSRKTGILNISANPSKAYFISTSLDYIDDTEQGVKNSTDLSFRAEPLSVLRADGKYTITSVKEDFVTSEGVVKHTGSLSLDLRPFNYLRLRYLYKPNFTKILRTDSLSFNNEQQQTELNLTPVNEVLLGLLYKVGHGFNINRQDAPNYTTKDNTSDTDSALYSLKMAPFRIFSTEFNYLLENGRTTQLTTLEPAAYVAGQSFNKRFDTIVKTSLSEKFSIDTRYTYQQSTQGSGEAANNIGDSVSHTASLKGVWNISDAWSVSLAGAYTKMTNFLSSSPVTYTASPGCGFIYRQGDRLRVDFDYTYSKSYAGAVTELTNYSLRGKYSLSDYVNVTLRGQQELSRSPDYRLTDITGNIEINL